jgi:excisionase family DNA binding protein
LGPAPDEFLTVAEIAELLKPNPQTVRNMIDRGGLAGVRVGERRVRMRRSDLDRFIEAGAMERPAQPEPAEVDAGSVTAWVTSGAATAEATVTLARADHSEMIGTLNG